MSQIIDFFADVPLIFRTSILLGGIVIFWILVIILCPSIHQLVLEDEIPTNSNNNEDDIILEDLSEIFINESEFAKKNIYDSGISRFEVNRKSAISYLYWLSVLVCILHY